MSQVKQGGNDRKIQERKQRQKDLTARHFAGVKTLDNTIRERTKDSKHLIKRLKKIRYSSDPLDLARL